MQSSCLFYQLTLYTVLLSTSHLLHASFCGKSGVPYSFEVLPSGAPVLGCAQPSCVLSPAVADEPNSAVEDSEFLTDVNGQADGFFREGDRGSKRYRHPNAPRLIANCSGGFNELSCPRKNHWVGGIEYIDHPRQPLILQCCTFDGLRFSQEVGSTTVGPGEAITGGEVIRNGRQISFDVIANVRKIVKPASSTSSKVNYEVTVRRMNCLPDPPEPEVQFDGDLPAEVFKVLSSASNKDIGTTDKLEKKTGVLKQEKKPKVKQQAAPTEQLPEISDSTNQVQKPQLPPPQQQPSPTSSGVASNHNFEASIGPVATYNQQQFPQPQPIAAQQPLNPPPIYPQQQLTFPATETDGFQAQPQYPQQGGFASFPAVTPAPLESTAFQTFSPLAIHTFPTHTFPTHTFPTLPPHTFPTHTFAPHSFPTHTFHPFPTFAPAAGVTPAPASPFAGSPGGFGFAPQVPTSVFGSAQSYSPGGFGSPQTAPSGFGSAQPGPLGFGAPSGHSGVGSVAFAAPSISSQVLPLTASSDSSATSGSLIPLGPSVPAGNSVQPAQTSQPQQQQIPQQQVAQPVKPQPSSAVSPAAPVMMMGVPAMGTVLEALQGPNYHPITMPGLGVIGYSNSATKK